MRRVPEFLPPMIRVMTNPHITGGVMLPGNGVDSKPIPIVSDAHMKFVIFQSPALINGLLMTEITTESALGSYDRTPRIERFFFGYQCGICEEVFLVPTQVRREEDLQFTMRHPCEQSELRRAVRNARRMGLERGEHIMEGPDGRWWPERHDWNSKYLQEPFTNDYVYSRDQVSVMFSRGKIGITAAEEMLGLRYETRNRKIDYLK